jgi:putative transposase
MPRSARILDPEGVYHVVCRGNDRQSVFRDAADLRAFKRLLVKCKRELAFHLHHYVLMTNHFHLVIQAGAAHGLSEVMKWLNQSYSIYYKKKYGTIGHLWQDRFHSKLVVDDRHLLMCGIYIELNPVRAGICSQPQDYYWSSYQHYAHGRHDPLIDDSEAFLGLSADVEKRRAEYRDLVDFWMD